MRALAVLVVVGSLLAAGPTLADKPGKAKGRNRDGKAAHAAQVGVSFSLGQREAVQGYFVEKHGRGGCPPGLAKKGNGCLPPGQAKKRYAIGQRWPAGVPRRPLPAELSIRIGAPPAGYAYAVLDGDLVKLAVGTLLVVDAIEGLVN